MTSVNDLGNRTVPKTLTDLLQPFTNGSELVITKAAGKESFFSEVDGESFVESYAVQVTTPSGKPGDVLDAIITHYPTHPSSVSGLIRVEGKTANPVLFKNLIMSACIFAVDARYGITASDVQVLPTNDAARNAATAYEKSDGLAVLWPVQDQGRTVSWRCSDLEPMEERPMRQFEYHQ